MFDTPVQVPDRISTLELSKIWLQKALQEFQPLPTDDLECPEDGTNAS